MSDESIEADDAVDASGEDAPAEAPPTGPLLAGYSTPPPPRSTPSPAASPPAPPLSPVSPTVSPAMPPPPPPVPVSTLRWRSLEGLTQALTVLLVLAAAAAVFAVVAFLRRISALGNVIDGLDTDSARRVHDADDLVRVATGIMSLLSFTILVLIIIWTFRAAKNNEALGRQHPRLKPGWGIAGWLIPLANAVIPVLLLQDLWRGSDPTTPRDSISWRSDAGSALIGWYWTFLLISVVRSGLGTSRASLFNDQQLRDLRNHDTVAIVGLLAAIAAAILGIQVVRRIAARQAECLRTQQGSWYRPG